MDKMTAYHTWLRHAFPLFRWTVEGEVLSAQQMDKRNKEAGIVLHGNIYERACQLIFEACEKVETQAVHLIRHKTGEGLTRCWRAGNCDEDDLIDLKGESDDDEDS